MFRLECFNVMLGMNMHKVVCFRFFVLCGGRSSSWRRVGNLSKKKKKGNHVTSKKKKKKATPDTDNIVAPSRDSVLDVARRENPSLRRNRMVLKPLLVMSTHPRYHGRVNEEDEECGMVTKSCQVSTIPLSSLS